MPTGAVAHEDPRRGPRLAVAALGAGLFGLAALTTDAIILADDGTHGAFWTQSPVKGLILAAVGGLGYLLARNPHRPDVRVVRSAMLAVGLVALVVGLDAFTGALELRDTTSDARIYPGVAPWSLLVAAALFLLLRWNRSLWPESRWSLEVATAASRRGRA